MTTTETVEQLANLEFIKIPAKETVYDACLIMTKHNTGAILAVEGVKVVGIFTERDVMKKVVSKGKNPLETPISKVMTKDLFTVPKDTKPTVAIEIMHRKKIRHLPIVDRDQKIIGLISLRGLLNVVIKNLVSINRNMQMELDQLRFFRM